jgi:uncharacterized membrane protein YeaQ/YmgE (transglycosylase-associated protein family)
MGVLEWVLLGLIAGSIAGMATGNRGEGCLTRIAIGVVGALIGGALARAAGLEAVSLRHFSLSSVLVATAGATLLLLVLQAVSGAQRPRRRR